MFVKERFELDQYTKDTLRDMEPRFGFDGFGEFIFYRTYSRIRKDGGQENWADVVIRVTEGTFSIRKDWYIKNHIDWSETFWQDYAHKFAISMFNMEWLPPGRGLWAMGTDFIYERGGMALHNCSYTALLDDLADDFDWFIDSLMLGCGVGFTPYRNDKLSFKIITAQYPREFVIPDSREGWIKSIHMKLEAVQQKKPQPRFIYDQIREAGLLIRGFGGLSSGPKPLIELHCNIDGYIHQYMTDEYYDSVRLKTDIANAIGICVVAGNVRRSAELGSLSIKDSIFKYLKDYSRFPEREEIGWMSNMSVDLEEDEDFEMLDEIAEMVKVRGEPGYKNLRNFKYGRIGKETPVREDRAKGVNPCFSKTATILTKEGIRTFEQLNIDDIIWSEEGWCKVINKWSTGINKIYKYTTTAGVFYSTEDHKIVSKGLKIAVKDTISIDTLKGRYEKRIKIIPELVMDGLALGDGTTKHGHILVEVGQNDTDYFISEIKNLFGDSYSTDTTHPVSTTLKLDEIPYTFLRRIPKRYFQLNKNGIYSFLRGLYTANGSICGERVTLKSASKGLIEDVQLLLSSVGIQSYFTTNKATIVEFSNGEYLCKKSYDLNISIDKDKFYESIGFIQKYKMEKLKNIINIANAKRNNREEKSNWDIISVELISEEETFDITVNNENHTFWCQGFNVSNCGEIQLEGLFDYDNIHRVREVCNVDETCPTVCNSPLVWLDACEYATFYASTVSLLPTHQPSTNRVVARNRRIGVSIIDWTGWVKQEGLNKVTKWMRKGYERVTETNRRMNGEAGIPEAIRKTCIKPGGTIPKLVGKTSGIGYPTFAETLRRVRLSKNSALCSLLIEANIPYEEDKFDSYTWVFEWPIIQGPSKPAYKTSLWEQAVNLTIVQREWADNSVSNTLYFKPKWVLTKVYNNIENDRLQIFDDLKDILTHDEYSTFILAYNDEEDEIVIINHKITIKYGDNYEPIEFKYFIFDPQHEEDIIEPVLSAVAPLIKSLSVLPHSAKGAYSQMPEQGLMIEEYNKRKATIKKIDWSRLSGSDGEDEKYCQGDNCEISVPMK